jgi:hypothetical protein
MATYTMELKNVIVSVFGEPNTYDKFTFNGVTYGKLPTVPDYSLIGLGTYPIFAEGYRNIINGKIIDEYYTREIGTETIDNWLLMIRRKMDQIMPYFNQLYLSLDIPYSALDTMNIHSVSTGDIDVDQKTSADTASNSDTKNAARSVTSETPQTMLSGNEDYATSASDSNSEGLVNASSSQSSDTDTKTTRNLDNLVTGYQAAASDLIMKYRASLINVDTMVLTSIEDCFMALLNNGDEYYTYNYYDWMV